MNPETVEAGWKSLERAALPADVHPIQRQEMRRAFYAGVQWLLTAWVDSIMTLDDDEGAARLELISRECGRFADDVRKGHA